MARLASARAAASVAKARASPQAKRLIETAIAASAPAG